MDIEEIRTYGRRTGNQGSRGEGIPNGVLSLSTPDEGVRIERIPRWREEGEAATHRCRRACRQKRSAGTYVMRHPSHPPPAHDDRSQPAMRLIDGQVWAGTECCRQLRLHLGFR